LSGGEPNALLLTPTASRSAARREYQTTAGERLASWVYVRMMQLGHSNDAIHDFLEAEGLPREPTTVSAVLRIAEATGVTAAEVLALLGVDDVGARRHLRSVPKTTDAASDEDRAEADSVETRQY